MNKNLVFIASGGRTGTQFFGNRLGEVISDCWSEHEPDMFHGISRKSFERVIRFGVWHMAIGRLLGQSGIRQVSQRYMRGQLTREECHRKIRSMRSKYHAKIKESLVVESYYVWWVLAGDLTSIWPGSKVIGIIRDPRTWINSWLKHYPARRSQNMVERVFSNMVTPAQIGDDYWASRWNEIGQIGRLAWEWKTIYERLSDAAKISPHVRIFRFEDLFRHNDHQPMYEMVKFAAAHTNRKYKISSLDGFTSTVLNANPGHPLSWENWSSGNARVVHELCARLMSLHGYGQEHEWKKKLNDY